MVLSCGWSMAAAALERRGRRGLRRRVLAPQPVVLQGNPNEMLETDYRRRGPLTLKV